MCSFSVVLLQTLDVCSWKTVGWCLKPIDSWWHRICQYSSCATCSSFEYMSQLKSFWGQHDSAHAEYSALQQRKQDQHTTAKCKYKEKCKDVEAHESAGLLQQVGQGRCGQWCFHRDCDWLHISQSSHTTTQTLSFGKDHPGQDHTSFALLESPAPTTTSLKLHQWTVQWQDIDSVLASRVMHYDNEQLLLQQEMKQQFACHVQDGGRYQCPSPLLGSILHMMVAFMDKKWVGKEMK